VVGRSTYLFQVQRVREEKTFRYLSLHALFIQTGNGRSAQIDVAFIYLFNRIQAVNVVKHALGTGASSVTVRVDCAFGIGARVFLLRSSSDDRDLNRKKPANRVI